MKLPATGHFAVRLPMASSFTEYLMGFLPSR